MKCDTRAVGGQRITQVSRTSRPDPSKQLSNNCLPDAKMKTQLAALLSLTLPFTANAHSYVGCYSDPGSLVFEGGYAYQSDGYCTEVCSRLEKPVMATSAGTKCFCGDEVPPPSASVPKSKCNVACAGFPNVMCKFLVSSVP